MINNHNDVHRMSVRACEPAARATVALKDDADDHDDARYKYIL